METKVMNGYTFNRYQPTVLTSEEIVNRSRLFFDEMNTRRTVRDFSNKPVSSKVIDNLIRTASTAPSGAHKQPWTFCVVSKPEIKKQIRIEAEKEEKESYTNRMSEEWLRDVQPLQTDWQKPFLEIAPHLIIVFKKAYDLQPDGTKRNNYYVSESVGIACGFLLTAIHHAGLVALTHTPNPMNFLSKILDRPGNERPFLLIPVGYAADETFVPHLKRKKLTDVVQYY